MLVEWNARGSGSMLRCVIPPLPIVGRRASGQHNFAHTHRERTTDVAGGTKSALPSLDTLIPDVPRLTTVSLLPRMSLLAPWSNDTGFASLTLERAHVGLNFLRYYARTHTHTHASGVRRRHASSGHVSCPSLFLFLSLSPLAFKYGSWPASSCHQSVAKTGEEK
jgi:hypothetical protein